MNLYAYMDCGYFKIERRGGGGGGGCGGGRGEGEMRNKGLNIRK